jgi:putative SOS response-associated peptidase YedK
MCRASMTASRWILPRDRWADWLDGAPDTARLLCQPYPADMVVRKTILGGPFKG